MIGVTLAGLGVRLLLLSPSYALPGVDELGYASDGLLLLEGVTPGYKFAPAAITTWTGFFYGAITSLMHLFDPAVIDQSASLLIRPLFAIDLALFETYADMSGLWFALKFVSLTVSLLGIVAAALLGRHYGGWSGALASGGLMALLPLIAFESVTSRPYAVAWSLATVSIASGVVLRSDRRYWVAGLVFGLAVASRIEMLVLSPLLIWAMWPSVDRGTRVYAFRKTIGIALVSFLVAAPWFVTHLVGNVRKIVTVKLISPETWDITALVEGASVEGLTVAILVVLVGLALRARREPGVVLVALLFVLLSLLGAARPSSGGLRHQGDAFILIVILTGYAFGGLSSSFRGLRGGPRILQGGAALLVLILPFFRVVDGIEATRASWVKHDAVGWIEEHVREGTPVFFNGLIIHAPAEVPLPTRASADRRWAALTHPEAWRKKFHRRAREAGIHVERVPRALSMEHMYQQLGDERRYFILGGEGGQGRRRYDLRIGLSPDIGTPEMRTFVREFERVGGVFLRFGDPIERLGDPSKSWIAPNGDGVFLYHRPEGSGT